MTMEPTGEFVTRSLELSQEFLDDSKALLEQLRLRSAIDRAYYSIHFGAVAILAAQNIRPPKSHTGLVMVFGRDIISVGIMDREYGRMLSVALRERSSSTYAASSDVTLEDAEFNVSNAERFLLRVRSILNS